MNVFQYVVIASEMFAMLLASVMFKHARFEMQDVCPPPSYPVHQEYTGVQNGISCGALCSGYSGCTSFTYSNATTTCNLSSEVWTNTTTSGCADKVSYGVKEACSGPCTTPMSNVRLCEGSGRDQCSDTKGRLELYRDGIWGTVSFHGWADQHATKIICRTLGYSSGTTRYARPRIGTGRLWMSHVRCTGNETSLFDCNKRMYPTHTCSHYEDVEISCI